MADGSIKNITDVVVGDTVKTLDGTQPVTELFQYNVTDTYEIAFEDGTMVTATPNHKFLTTDGRWVRADELRETDEIQIGLSTEMPLQLAMKITRITKQTAPVTVYDFTVQGAHHYFLSNGVVSHNSYFPTKEMAGGQGAKYAADTIVFLSKKKDRDAEKSVVGNIVKARMMKSRLTKEETAVETRILFDGGLDRYYGILDMAIAQGCVKKVSTRYEFPDGSKVFEKAILREPEKYFTKDVLDCVEVYVKEHFLYGSSGTSVITDDELEAESE